MVLKLDLDNAMMYSTDKKIKFIAQAFVAQRDGPTDATKRLPYR